MVASILFAGVFALANVANVAAIELNVEDKGSIKSAAKTIVEDMVKTYYPKDATVGLTQSFWGEEDPYPIKYSAMFWDNLLNYWFLTGDDQYNDKVGEGILAQLGENGDFFPRDLWDQMDNEDQVAWALTSLAAAERQLPNPSGKESQWLNLSTTVFDIQANLWDTDECDGGIRVNRYAAFNGNGYYNKRPGSWFLILAARLGAFTGNETYFDWAEKAYSWAAGAPGLVTSDFAVYSGLSLTGGQCGSPVKFEYTFNQAAFLYASSVVYNATSSETWRKRVEGHLGRFSTFFVHESDKINATDSAGGNVLTEQTCAKITRTCSADDRYYKSLAARWMSHAAVAAPSIAKTVGSYLKESASLAAKSCTGTESGKMCSLWWETGKYVSDASTGLGEEISALEIIQQNLNGPHIKLATANSTISNPDVTSPSPGSTPDGNDNPSGSGDSKDSKEGMGDGEGNDNAAGRLGLNIWAFVTFLVFSVQFW